VDDIRESRIAEIAAALPAEYVLADADWNECEPKDVESIGSGGSSIVLPALYRGRLKRAFKVFLPRADLRATLDMSHFRDSYENEVSQQAVLSHEHVSKITDFSAIKMGEETYPFIATEYIHGTDLRRFARDAPDGRHIFKALADVLSGLDYLHRSNVLHSDLKPENILVRTDNAGEDISAVIVDLGSSKYFPETEDGASEEELLHLFTSTDYAPSRLRLVVSNWTKNRIPRKELRKFFPYMDLHAFGVILDKLLQDAEVRRKLGAAASNSDVFDYFVSRLKNSRPGNDYFQSASQVQTALGRVSYRTIAPLSVPELGPTPRKGVVIPGIRARVHGGGRVDRLMSHPLFQRFHLLPQLDLLYWTLPGATNSRYVHAAHSFDIARKAISFALNDWRFRIEVTKEDIESTIYSALINQLGHYHFLHMFEDLLEERGSEPRVHAAQLLRDDELIDSILGLLPSSIGSELAAIKDERGRTFPQVVDSLGLNWETVRRRQRHPESPLEGMLAALLSGPLDVEKLAYLRDDSRATGIQFGVGLDGSPIFESLVIPTLQDWQRYGGARKVAMGVTEQAMAYLEYGVLTRYWNIQTAYWNRTNRAVQSMLKYQIASLIRIGRFDFDGYIRDTLFMGPDGALRWLNDRFLKAIEDGEIAAETVNPMEDILESRRSIYRRLVTISGKSRIPGRDPDYQIFSRIQRMSPLNDEEVTNLVADVLRSVDTGMRIMPGEILVDLPRAPRDETQGKVLVYTDDTFEYMGELFDISPNLQQHQQSFDQYVKRMRIFLHPRVYLRLYRGGALQNAYSAVLEALRGQYAR